MNLEGFVEIYENSVLNENGIINFGDRKFSSKDHGQAIGGPRCRLEIDDKGHLAVTDVSN